MSKIQDRLSATLTTESIGRTQAFTPDGFLLCSDVRIARTGPMLYARDEMPDIDCEPGKNMITIMRDADVLFHEDSIRSFAGKPVTNDHPPQFVSPSTYKRDQIGTVLNPRRGEGAEAEYLIADLLIGDAQAISDIRAGKREVSCGYDADREQVKPGLGRQTKVTGNHVALVDRGRCGPSCAILDKENTDMAKRSVWDRLMTAFKANDEGAFKEELEKAKDEAAEEPKKDDDETMDKLAKIVRDAIKPLADKVAKLTKDAEEKAEEEAEAEKKKAADAKRAQDEEAAKAEEEKKKTEDSAKRGLTDSASLRDEYADVTARAEVLSPGIHFPTFDAKAPSVQTTDALCKFRVSVLDKAYADPKMRPHIASVLGGAPAKFADMTCDAAAMVFRSASELAKMANNRSAGGGATNDADKGVMTAAKMQAMIAERRKAK